MISTAIVVRITGLYLLSLPCQCSSNPPHRPIASPLEDHITPNALLFEYETMPYPPPWVPIHSKDRYVLTRRLGTGKFSDVFEAIDLGPHWKDFNYDFNNQDDAVRESTTKEKENNSLLQNPRVVIKCLKPIAERKIRRELYLLHCCRHLPNIIRLKALILPNCNDDDDALLSMPCFVMEHAGTEWLGPAHLDPPLTAYEIRYFAFQLLLAMRALHQAGIMHRDIKPRNVMIQRSRCSNNDAPKLTLIDLGLADVYQPGRAYNVRVASRHYKAPELLLGDTYYHGPAVDVWAFGCLLASLLSGREPFFRGRDLDDQLVAIQNVLGTAEDDWQAWIVQQYGPAVAEALQTLEARPRRPVPWCPNDPTGDDLVQRILQYDPAKRYTTEQILAHAFFDPVRERCETELSSRYQKQQQ